MNFEKFDYLKYKNIYFLVFGVLAIFSLILMIFWKINLWIDMTWGIQAEYSYKKNIDLEKAKLALENQKNDFKISWNNLINNINVYKVTWENSISVVTWINDVKDKKILEQTLNNYRKKSLDILKNIDNTTLETSYQNIWKTFWDYIKYTAYLTLTLAILWIFIYVYYAFSGSVAWIAWFSFWFVTLLTLFNDVLITAWLYFFFWLFFPWLQVDIYFITALLTILGYSINDTIVIFDRIRENLKTYAWKKDWKNLYEIINLSILETFKRSIYTSLTLFFVLLTIISFGPEALRWFIFVMLIWTVVWTVSSIFLSSPILYFMNKNKTLTVYKKKVYNPEDKIVV